jgi:CelD/BcsL family acetyltransferase involved in cellulose biosynthesis
MGFQVETLATRAELDERASDWNDLGDRVGCPLVRHEWLAASASAFARDGDLVVFESRDSAGRLRAGLPLVRHRIGPATRLRLLGQEVMEPITIGYDHPHALAAVCAAAMDTGLPLSLPRLQAESEQTDALAAAARRRGFPVVRPSTTQTHATVLGSDFAAFEKAMTSRQASIIRRRRKKLGDEHGEVVFEALSPDEASVETALADLFRVEAAGWKAREGTSMLHDAAMGAFVREYARLTARTGLLRIFNLRVAGQVVACQMVVEHADRLWGIKLGTDEAFYKYGVGVMVTHDIMRWATERRLKTFEHLGAAEEYQRRWPLETRQQNTFHFYPVSASGGVAFASDAVAFMRRRARQRTAPRAASAAAEQAA